jgi:hypothetical protein
MSLASPDEGATLRTIAWPDRFQGLEAARGRTGNCQQENGITFYDYLNVKNIETSFISTPKETAFLTTAKLSNERSMPAQASSRCPPVHTPSDARFA